MVGQKQQSGPEKLQNLAKGFEFCLEVMKAMEKSLNFWFKLKISLKEIEGKIEGTNI